MARMPIAAGNWKMNGLAASLAEPQALIAGWGGRAPQGIEVVVCPPATLITALAQAVAGSGVKVGGQDCHAAPAGAHTGDLSAVMIADAGGAYAIVGHSERRAAYGETDAAVAAKARAAAQAGLIPIVCVGETLAERDAGRAEAVVRAQTAASTPADLPPDRLVVAYEPVWAIGTGRTPTPADVQAMHAAIRDELARAIGAGAAAIRILYGGSVKPDNAAGLMALPDVDGALVGGASLTAADFAPIVATIAAKAA